MLTRKKEPQNDSDEEPESYVRPPTKNGADINSTTSASSNSEVRIKIRKNSIDPYAKMKANHNQVIQQKLKEQRLQQ